MTWRRPGASDQWWLVYWCIYASRGLNELRYENCGNVSYFFQMCFRNSNNTMKRISHQNYLHAGKHRLSIVLFTYLVSSDRQNLCMYPTDISFLSTYIWFMKLACRVVWIHIGCPCIILLVYWISCEVYLKWYPRCQWRRICFITWWRHQMESPHKGQWGRALTFSLICALNKRLSKQS